METMNYFYELTLKYWSELWWFTSNNAKEISINIVSDVFKYGWAAILAIVVALSSSAALFLKRMRGKDDYGPLYGTWHVYRVAGAYRKELRHDVIPTTITVHKKRRGNFPVCTFRTEWTNTHPESDGYVSICGPNLFFHFTKTKGENSIFGDFCYWVPNIGYNEFREIKHGFSAGVLSAGRVFSAEILMSRFELDHRSVSEALTRTKSIGPDESVKKIIPFLEKRA